MTGNKKGNIGENTAASFLSENGYIIRERNYHSRYGEIDIICEKDGFIVFTEVKLRKKNPRVGTLESVSAAKQRKIIETSVMYMQDRDISLQPRYDVVSITEKSGGGYSVELIENAFDTQNLFY